MYKKLIFIAAAAVSLAGCSNDDFSDWNEKTDGQGITFGATATDAGKGSRGGSASLSHLTLRGENKADTLSVAVEQSEFFAGDSHISRGTPTTDATFSSFQVFAFYHKDNTVTTPTIFFKEIASKNTNDRWSTNTLYYWPTTEGSTLSFFAVSPEINADSENLNGLRFATAEDPAAVDQAVISYLAPATVENQPDLMVASHDKINNKDTNQPVPMAFRHILSQVRFRVGTEMQEGTIKSITVTNVRKHGYYNQATGSWTLDEEGTDDFKDYTVEFNQETATTTPEGTMMGTSEKTLMMLPQTLSDQSELIVEFLKKGTDTPVQLRASIAGQQWLMNGSTVYNINIKPDYTLDFVEESLPKEAKDCHYLHFPIKVNAADLQGKNWTITSDESWCTVRDQLHGPENQGFWIISPTGYPSEVGNDDKWQAEYDKYKHEQSMTMSATGESQIYIFLAENTGAEERSATLTLSVEGTPVSSTEIRQLAPIQDGTYFMENIEEETNLPWGFHWTRKVVYEGKKESITGLIYHYLFCNIYARNWSQQYAGYNGVDIQWGKTTILGFTVIDANKQPVITIDYSQMSPSTDINDIDGSRNTYLLFTNAGGNVIGLETAIRSYTSSFQVRANSESGTLENEGNYAALSCLKKNAFNIMVNMSEADGKKEYNAAVNVTEADVKWYLPASGQSGAFPVGEGDYWSSTPISTHSQANLMVGGTSATPTDRSLTYKLRAVRNKQ